MFVPIVGVLLVKCIYKLIHKSLASLEKYHTIGSWFLGPRGENAGIMKEQMNRIVDHVNLGRISFGHKDEVHLVSLMTTSQTNCPTIFFL